MTKTIDQIDEQVMQLSLGEQEELVERILARLDAGGEIDEEGFAEAERRYEEMRSGKVPGIPYEEFMANLRAKLQ